MTDSSAPSAAGSKRSRAVASVGSKAQHVLQDDYGKAKTLALDALRSRSYLYPIKGIFYFLTHRALWKPFLARLGPYVSLYVSVVGSMFFFTYLPQLAVLVFVNGPLAVFTTVVLILNESSALVNAISRGWILQDAILDTFDGTLVARNAVATVSQGRELRSGADPMQRLGKKLMSPFERFSPTALVRYLIYLPLNFIPVVGTAIFLLLQARNRGKLVHGRYFQLKKWSPSRRSHWLEQHVGPYTAFGLVATLLEMIPLASIFFTFTNTVGAALWAADIEALDTSMTDDTAPTLRERATKAE
ncbi:hypothetical protein L249_2918 [Ophiocordyceps polyrhachis-furcata BCC 54312]|uniref:Outer spore wall protein RRT8 n=1 Tax=Ophiocordyceps polyrhachis-furcata BCC 54312 TaxID=1330021 RepID=A0A367LNA5_9HYPO|nr:hypothetical protein L249_2918 [Ophiocordyceps polyrhachis-furcata BCC 54312]